MNVQSPLSPPVSPPADPQPDPADRTPSRRFSPSLIVLVAVLGLALAGQYVLYRQMQDALSVVAQDASFSKNNATSTPEASSLNAATAQAIQALQNDIDSLKSAQQSFRTQAQNDLQSLTETTATLRNKVETETAAKESEHHAMRARLFGLMALIHLENSVRQGDAFADDLKRIEATGLLDAEAQSLIGQLAPFSSGVASWKRLRDTLRLQATQAEHEWKKREAQRWQDRLRLTLSGLIRLRPLDASAQALETEALGRYAPLYAAVHAENGPESETQLHALPEPAQESLGAWRDDLRQRRRVDQLLSDLTQKMIPPSAPHD